MPQTVQQEAKIVPRKFRAWKLLGSAQGRRTRWVTLLNTVLASALIVFAGARLRKSWRSQEVSWTKKSPRRSASFPIEDVQQEYGRGAPEACPKVYIDLGSNIGDSRTDFANGDIQGSRRSFQQNTGISFNASDFCAYGFEGNPKWTRSLRSTETSLKSRFRSIEIFAETVVDGRNGSATLYLDTVNTRHNNWGTSMIEEHRDVKRSGRTAVTVRAVDFAEFLRSHTTPPGSPRSLEERMVVVRMDIEGMEYTILQSLVSAGLLCSRVDFFWVEWHHNVVAPEVQGQYVEKTRVFEWLLKDNDCHSILIPKWRELTVDQRNKYKREQSRIHK